jgi:uncharacterized protein YndB with AHSA1/START domain
MSDFGAYERNGDVIDVRFVRHYPRPPETVWKALTEPARLADWMGRSHVEPRVGGRYETMLDGHKPMHGTVLVWDPPTSLELHWSNGHAPDSTVRFELSPAPGGGTRLEFTHQRMPFGSSALMLPGWHIYFERLGQALAGQPPPPMDQRWREMQAIYIDRLGLSALQRDP